MSFDSTKRELLSKISLGHDLSPKGSIDLPIGEVILININFNLIFIIYIYLL